MVHQTEGVDHGIDQHEQRGGHEQRPLHAAKEVPARRALDGRGLLQAGVQRLQRGQVEDHEEARLLPHRHHRDAGQRRGRVAQPVARRQPEQAGDLLQQPVLRRVEEQPDVGHGDHRQHGGREVRHAHPRASRHALIHPQRHDQRQADGQRNGRASEPQVVAHGLPEHGVVHHGRIVLQPHPHPRTAAAGRGMEAVDQRGQRGPVREGHQQDQGRKQQQPGVHGTLAAARIRRAAHHRHGRPALTCSCAECGRPRAVRPSSLAPRSWCRSARPGWRR